MIYQLNDTIRCSSANNTEVLWYIVNPELYIQPNQTYSVGQRGLNITNVQLYHEQQYKCEHLLESDPSLARSVIINVQVLGKQRGI